MTLDDILKEIKAAEGLAAALESLVEMIDAEGPPAVEWRAISIHLETDVAEALAAGEEARGGSDDGTWKERMDECAGGLRGPIPSDSRRAKVESWHDAREDNDGSANATPR